MEKVFIVVQKLEDDNRELVAVCDSLKIAEHVCEVCSSMGMKIGSSDCLSLIDKDTNKRHLISNLGYFKQQQLVPVSIEILVDEKQTKDHLDKIRKAISVAKIVSRFNEEEMETIRENQDIFR